MRNILLPFLLSVSTMWAQQTFTVATLNVDGLPEKLVFLQINPDGPGSAGTLEASRYLLDKGYDIVAVQENFNYHNELYSALANDYDYDEWMGPINVGSIGMMNLLNLKLETDGLTLFWKKQLRAGEHYREAWTMNYGKLDHDNDDLITKGFRRQVLTLADGTEIVVYNLHMDSTNNEDFARGEDGPDRQARTSQWTQLRNHLLTVLDHRPVIILGDTNSKYDIDDIDGLFFTPINATGTHTAVDVWRELGKGKQREEIDKIIYINPLVEGKCITPVCYRMETDYVDANGKQIGDHRPVTVSFVVDDIASGIVRPQRHAIEDTWHTLSGTLLSGKPTVKGLYLKNGKKVVVR